MKGKRKGKIKQDININTHIDYEQLTSEGYEGTFIGNEKGYGFIEVEGKDEDIFVSPDDVFTAMNGDTVYVRIKKAKDAGYSVESEKNDARNSKYKKSVENVNKNDFQTSNDESNKKNSLNSNKINSQTDNKGSNSTNEVASNTAFSRKKRAEGVITEILKRAITETVGTYEKGKGFGFVVADDKRIYQDIHILGDHQGKAKNNDKVVVQIISYPSQTKKAEGKIIEVLGKANDTNVDLISVIKAYGYKTEFPKEVQKEAKSLPQVVLKTDGRVDLRDKMIFTIDGDDTKDIDDAVSLDVSKDKYVLGVHIADVSNYVLDGSELDKEAVKRSTSVYLIDYVIPMLPKELSNGICSLNEAEDRNALSIDIVMDKDANVLNTKVYKSVICSKKKMTYNNVYKIIRDDNPEVPEGYEPFKDALISMKELCLKLKDKRHAKGAIDFEIPEPKVILDENKKVIEIKPYEITIANQMIEQFMVLANECIAQKFSELEIPFIYRIHEKPESDKLERLRILLKNLNYAGELSDDVKPYEIQKITEAYKGKEEEKIVSSTALRSMQLAKYYPENLGHFGLALENYCHFTSPIRRYPDLFIHRVISKYLAGELDNKAKAKFAKQSEKYSEQSSDMERESEEAERDLVAIKMCEYMQDHVGEEFEGVVSGVTNFGIFVELENTIEGLVHVTNMKDDYYEYDELNCTLTGENNRKVYKIGDKVKVKVLEANKMLKRIDFEIV